MLCGAENETVEHLFLKCVYTRFVWWRVAGGWLRDDADSDIRRFWETKRFSGEPRTVNKILERLAALWWAIWKARNGLIFQQKNSDPMQVASRVKGCLENWAGLGAESGDNGWPPEGARSRI